MSNKRKSKSRIEDDDISSKAAKMVAHAKQLVMDLSDSDDEKNDLPPYLPAVYGCRSVEEFEISNKVEEGTYRKIKK